MRTWDERVDSIYGKANTVDLTPIKPVKISTRATLKSLKLEKYK